MKFESEHIDNLIARHLAGEASQMEWEELLYWMETSPENKKYFDGIKFVHDKAVASHRLIKVDTGKAWQNLSARMNVTETRVADISLPVYKKTWFRIAASMALLVGISAIFFFMLMPGNRSESFSLASNDSIVKHSIDNHTDITLNRNSKIEYKEKKNQKEIILTGEAFINVLNSSEKQLTVHAGETFIRDIGTAFNVKAFPGSATIEVYVESGEVIFYTSEDKGLTLKAGETGLYNKVKKEFIKPDAVDINAIAYKSKLFVFHNTPLKKALSALNSVYSRQIELANPDLGNCSITVTFDSESPEAIADIIAETLGLQVSGIGSRIILEGETCSSQP